jgi:hypothetical protein
MQTSRQTYRWLQYLAADQAQVGGGDVHRTPCFVHMLPWLSAARGKPPPPYTEGLSGKVITLDQALA